MEPSNQKTIIAQLDELRSHTEIFIVAMDLMISRIGHPQVLKIKNKSVIFRYHTPMAIHFCFLKAVKAISGLNAAIKLAESGFNQEICVLIRTIIDCCSQIEYVMAGINGDAVEEKIQNEIKNFFADSNRSSMEYLKDIPKTTRQKDIHKSISKAWENSGVVINTDSPLAEVAHDELMYRIYQTFSNYVHAKYPEIMDMYGGNPPRFHMKGILDAKKDAENIELLKSQINTVALVLLQMIEKFDMNELIKRHHIAKQIMNFYKN